MSAPSPIPCTVAILTRNSAATLERALTGVKDFSDIIICDGGSSDATRSIAGRYGARIIDQDPAFLNEGKIRDFAAVRNQTLDAARYEWFFFLDSDEYVDDDVVEEIRQVVTGKPTAFWIPRRYVFEGSVITCSTGYPNQQMRLFHTSVAKRFIKKVHERIELIDGAPVRFLRSYMLVPVSGNVDEARRKWSYYLSLENEREPQLSIRRGLYLATRECLIGVRYFMRWALLWTCRGTRMPMGNELMRVWYQAALVRNIIKRIHFS